MTLFQKLILKYDSISCCMCSFISKCYASLLGVKLGSHCKFYGIPFFRVWSDANIVIGESCTFRSSLSSNTVGLYHKCMISAHGAANVSIGSGCGFSGTVISSTKKIEIGDRVLCGANVTIIDSDRHSIDYLKRDTTQETIKSESVHIGNDVWIGMNSTILKGVVIGQGAVIAANSVVVNDVKACSVYAGNPARFVKSIYE